MCAGFLRCVIKADIGLRAEFSFCSNSKLHKVAESHVSLVSFSKSLFTLIRFCYQWYAEKQKRVNRCSFFFFHLSGWSRSAWLISLLRLKVKLERIYFWHSVKKRRQFCLRILRKGHFLAIEVPLVFYLRKGYFLEFREIGNSWQNTKRWVLGKLVSVKEILERPNLTGKSSFLQLRSKVAGQSRQKFSPKGWRVIGY